MTAQSRSPLGICIVGCGGIAPRHAAALRRLKDRPRLFFASRSAEKAETYRARFGGDAGFGSHEQALGDERVHAAVICTPHNLHVEHALLAASRGVHVLMEKPLGRTLEEADEIIRAVRAAESKTGGRCVLMVAENFRFKPSVRKARRLIEAGAVGRVKCARVKISELSRHGGWRTDVERMGGGALLDGGIHWVDTLFCLAGAAKKVYAVRGPKTREGVPLEDTVHIISEHEGGVVGELTHSWGIPAPGKVQFSSVSGTEGTLYIENHGYFLYLAGKKRRIHLLSPRDRTGFTAMHAEFLRGVRARQSAMSAGEVPAAETADLSGDDGRRALAFVLAAYRSFREGRAVELWDDVSR